LILKNLVKVEYQLGDNLVLSLLRKILQPATLAIHEEQLILVDVIEMPGCLSLSSTIPPLHICRPGPALETITLDHIRSSPLQATSKGSCESASMGGRGENGRAKTAIPDALDDPSQAGGGTTRSTLKIVFVDSGSFGRRLRLRRSPTKAVKQTQNVSYVAGYEIFGDDADESAHSIRLEASEDEFDQDYDDDEGRTNKRPRTSRKMGHPRKQKRHGKLAAADRDLLFEAQKGGLAHKLPKNKAPRICKEDAIDLLARVAENIDWRRAVAVQHELQTTCKELLTEFGDTNRGRKSESSTMGEDTTLSDVQLKQYWSEVLVSSILDMKIKEADLKAGIAVGKKPGYHE
jgi:hypothetical protein